MVEKFKYLSPILTSDLRQDADIDRQSRALSVIGNMIARRFFKANDHPKIQLFRTYCQSFYTWLWAAYIKISLDGIGVQYKNIYRHLMGLAPFCCAFWMSAEARLNTFNAIQRSRITKQSPESSDSTCSNSIITDWITNSHEDCVQLQCIEVG